MKIAKKLVDEATINQFIAGDVKAFDAIFEAYNAKLENFAYSILKNESDTEETVQEIFVKLWEKRTSLKQTSSFESYLFSVAYNTSMTLIRKRSKEKHYLEYLENVNTDSLINVLESEFTEEELQQLQQRLNKHIEALPAKQQEAFKLKHFDRLSYQEIATSMNISKNTVENHIVKAHKYLRESLKKDYFIVMLLVSLLN
ncbi:RNA polymerase sigma-70 factor [Puteibacter caeruleilacunae]|nr:RNA polymerase sigma-70 factor [Puteibacter caeruleilacunae]